MKFILYLIKATLFLDMDNTLAMFSHGKRDDQRALVEAQKRGFFLNLNPVKNIWIYNILSLFIPTYIVSACNDNPCCMPEKAIWLRKHLPFIRKDHIIFTHVGENKAIKVEERLGRPICRCDFLVDDYGVNLKEWDAAGGTPIKKSYNPNRQREIPVIYDHKEIVSVLKKAIS